MSERSIMNRIQLALAKVGARLFRNQVGTYHLANGSYLSSGLGVGSSDLVGWHSIVIRPNMVGLRVAVFTAIEVKGPKGKTTNAQEFFIDAVKKAGGTAFVARSTEEAVKKLFKESTIANGTGH